MRHSQRIMRLLALLVILSLGLCSSTVHSWAAGSTPQYQAGEPEPPSKAMRDLERQQEKARNTQRHQDLKKDTDKLLQLATELKAAVDKSNENTLSMDVIKKAEEIEKLSKNVQKKMRGY